MLQQRACVRTLRKARQRDTVTRTGHECFRYVGTSTLPAIIIRLIFITCGTDTFTNDEQCSQFMTAASLYDHAGVGTSMSTTLGNDSHMITLFQ